MTITATVLGYLGRCIGKPPGYERVVRAVMPPGKMPSDVRAILKLEGAVFDTRPAVPIDWNLFFFGTYEPEVRRVMRQVLEAGSVAIDVGANIGWHTALMATLCGTSGRVLAFEPNTTLMQRLRRTLELNRLAHVEAIPVALSHESGRLWFNAPPADAASSGDGHILPPASRDAEHAAIVEARALDDMAEIANLKRLDLVKIDVEGFEWPVLSGAARTIAHFRPHVIFEHNEEYVARGGGSAADIQSYFTRHGYTLFALGRWGKQPIRKDAWPTTANVWAVPARRGAGTPS